MEAMVGVEGIKGSTVAELEELWVRAKKSVEP